MIINLRLKRHRDKSSVTLACSEGLLKPGSYCADTGMFLPLLVQHQTKYIRVSVLRYEAHDRQRTVTAVVSTPIDPLKGRT